MHLVQIGSEAAEEEAVYTDNKAIPSLALSFELGLGMAKTMLFSYISLLNSRNDIFKLNSVYTVKLQGLTLCVVGCLYGWSVFF